MSLSCAFIGRANRLTLFYSTRQQGLVYRKGHVLKVVVRALPRMSRSIAVTIGFQGKTYVEDIRGPGYLHVGVTVQMYLLKSRSLFSMPSEYLFETYWLLKE